MNSNSAGKNSGDTLDHMGARMFYNFLGSYNQLTDFLYSLTPGTLEEQSIQELQSKLQNVQAYLSGVIQFSDLKDYKMEGTGVSLSGSGAAPTVAIKPGTNPIDEFNDGIKRRQEAKKQG